MPRIAYILSILCLCLITTACAHLPVGDESSESFKSWLTEFKQKARTDGISERTLDAAFADVRVLERVIALDRKQPESTLTFDQYVEKIVSEKRLAKGKEMLAEHSELLKKISEEYHVQPEFIVALWGIETNYGSNTGNYQIVSALTTLAYEGRRREFFQDELLKVLHIAEDDNIPPTEIKGSWAGAMGQCQFMPSSFLNFAVDYDQDSKRDIWNTQEDVFASIANYLHRSGWDDTLNWGFKVKLPKGFNRSLADIKQSKSLSEWHDLGVRSTGKTWPKNPATASLILVGEGDDAEAYLVSENYKVLLRWNRSRYFATAVGMIAENIR